MITAILAALITVTTTIQPGPTASGPQVVFVCEHGAAKSLVATAYFNKLAAERGLKARATFRGVAPQDALSVSAVAGLKADGLTIPDGRPTAIADSDVAQATHIFAIGCTLPKRCHRVWQGRVRGTTCPTIRAMAPCAMPSCGTSGPLLDTLR